MGLCKEVWVRGCGQENKHISDMRYVREEGRRSDGVYVGVRAWSGPSERGEGLLKTLLWNGSDSTILIAKVGC